MFELTLWTYVMWTPDWAEVLDDPADCQPHRAWTSRQDAWDAAVRDVQATLAAAEEPYDAGWTKLVTNRYGYGRHNLGGPRFIVELFPITVEVRDPPRAKLRDPEASHA